ncbi:MAG: hypothetical protein M1819_006513 [Sarea resinae]|nr:MAG: hypothetical protein M1819_006513 [Sarea resinae]
MDAVIGSAVSMDHHSPLYTSPSSASRGHDHDRSIPIPPYFALSSPSPGMEHDSSPTVPQPSGQRRDRQDSEMEDVETLPNGHNLGITVLGTSQSIEPVDIDAMDVTPDGTQSNSASDNHSDGAERNRAASVHFSQENEAPETAGEAGPIARLAHLTRVTSNGSSIDSTDNIDRSRPAAMVDTENGSDTPTEIPSNGIGGPYNGVHNMENIPPPPPEFDGSPWGDEVHVVDDHIPGSRRPDQIEEDSRSESPDDDGPALVEIVEDTSVPSQQELLEIQETLGQEYSALDHDHWEQETFEELEDPEYRPGVCGRIEWIVNNVRPTKDNPKEELVRRSPAVRIGGFDWNIKFFPKGNGTEKLSIYIECSRPPSDGEANTTDQDGEAKDPTLGGSTSPSSENAPAAAAVTSPLTPTDGTSSAANGVITANAQQSASKKTFIFDQPAQIGCTLYNPAEPRVHYHHHTKHRFCSGLPDWGWTRFHGPHSEIHRRQYGQRQALLRNNTLAFTAYIRLIDDETGALWHESTFENPWDSFAKTGVRALKDDQRRSAFTSSIWVWSLLAPVRRTIFQFPVPDPIKEPRIRITPLAAALQRVFYQLQTPAKSDKSVISLSPITDALEYYGIKLTSDIDVIEFWQILRRKFEEEVHDRESSVGKSFSVDHDLSHFFDGAICNDPVYSTILAANCSPSFRIPVEGVSSIQEGLEKVLGGGTNFKKVPHFLQIELDRQVFDTVTRKWKKLVNKVCFDENVKIECRNSDITENYSLFGFIAHAGTLKSKNYYPVVRPYGPGTKWLKLAGHEVRCLTRRQAIDAHEGCPTDHSSDGAEPVAYVVMYVHDDVVQDTFERFPEQDYPQWLHDRIQLEGLHVNARTELIHKLRGEDDMPVELQIFNADIFKGHRGQGYVDVFEPKTHSDHIYHVNLNPDSTLNDVRKELATIVDGVEDPRQCRLWALDPTEDADLCFPAMVQEACSVRDLRDKYPSCMLWLHVVPPDELLPESDPVPATDSGGGVVLVQPPAGPDQARWDSNTRNEPDPRNPSRNSISRPDSTSSDDSEVVVIDISQPPRREGSNRIEGEEDPRGGSDHFPSAHADASEDDTAMGESASGTEQLSHSEAPIANTFVGETQMEEDARTLDEQVIFVDGRLSHDYPPALPPPEIVEVVMEGTSDRPPPPPAPPAGWGSEWQSDWDTSRSHEPRVDEVYLFLKHFDAAKQTLVGVGSYVVKGSDKVRDVVRQKLDLPEDKEVKLWAETEVNDAKAISANQTLDTEPCTEPCNRTSIIIYQDVLSEQDTNHIFLRGDFTTPDAYLAYLAVHTDSPMTINDGQIHTLSYFSSPYHRGTFLHNRPHGLGTHISPAGDVYTGPFVSGLRHGDTGNMQYANGDVYTGGWRYDQMSGQGRFVYAATGNVYEGGWKNGKRHGKGVMCYEVAEEDQRLCQICYEQEMDALFYDCGHVVACLECAKCVENCPVCRKQVLATVRIFKS